MLSYPNLNLKACKSMFGTLEASDYICRSESPLQSAFLDRRSRGLVFSVLVSIFLDRHHISFSDIPSADTQSEFPSNRQAKSKLHQAHGFSVDDSLGIPIAASISSSAPGRLRSTSHSS
jgi:hypothetical protein